MSFTTGHYEKIRAVAANAKLLLIGGARTAPTSQLTVADYNTNKTLRVIDLPAHVLGLSLGEEVLAVALANGNLWLAPLEDLTDEKKLKEPTGKTAHAGSCTSVAMSASGEFVATAGTDGFVRLWSTKSGAQTKEWKLSAQPLRAVAIDPNSALVAAAGDDGVVRSVTIASGEVRQMPGHSGPVFSLAFTPRDSRLVSGGEDGTLRIWYLVGDVESEVRGSGDDGHVGAVYAITFSPTPDAKKNEEPMDRIYSAGADGKIKSWLLDNKRKPKTIAHSDKAVYALAMVPYSAKDRKSGGVIADLFAGSDDRKLCLYNINTEGAFASDYASNYYTDGFADKGSIIGSYYNAKNAREAAIKALAPLDEPEALELMLRSFQNDREADNRALAAKLLGEYKRVDARPKLKEKLNDYYVPVRRASLDALRAIEGETSLSPLRAALESNYNDLKNDALTALSLLGKTSPLVPGLIAQKIADHNAGHALNLYALDCLCGVLPEPEALRMAFEKGNSAIKTEVLIRVTYKGLSTNPELSPIIGRALDDASGDSNVRRIAFAVKALERKALASHLEEKDDEFEKALVEISRRCAQLANPKETKAPSDEDVKAARQKIPGAGEAGATLTEDDLEPLLISMACRASDTALRGARGLAKLGDLRALGALLQLSREEQAYLRREAASSLKELEDPRAKKRLLWMLNDKDPKVREEALKGYKKLEGSRSLSVAESALRSSFEDIRNSGLKPLLEHDKTSKKHQEASNLLEDAIEDESEKVRGEAFKTLWAWYQEDPQKILGRALLARFADLRQTAIVELERLAKESWAEDLLRKTISDRDVNVATNAYEVVLKLKGKEDTAAHLAAIGSIHAALRTKAIKNAEKAADGAKLLAALLAVVAGDEDFAVRTVAVETLDKLSPQDPDPVLSGLKTTHKDEKGRLSEIWSVRVRAAELLAARFYARDNQLVDALQGFLGDKELYKWIDATALASLRQRAATSLASLGLNALMKYFSNELLKDNNPNVREQAARGMANAAQKGDEAYLLEALGHADVWVRSWAGDGLSRLGDTRALPVLTGTLRHDHPPIRLSAVTSFAALGPEGFGGMLQGLEDANRDIQEVIFGVILARDIEALRNQQSPDLLTSALSSQSQDIRYAAARALELRADPDSYVEYVIDFLMPPQPEKASDMKDWPAEDDRAKLVAALIDTLGSDSPTIRYAAAMALRIRRRPLEFFRELQRLASGRPSIPETTPKSGGEGVTAHKKGWLRKLFSKEKPKGEGKKSKEPQIIEIHESVPAPEQDQLRRLAFGAYVGLLRQSTTGDDDGHRVRRDSVDRVVDLGVNGGIGASASLPPILRALDDPHHLVRKAAFAGLKEIFKGEPQKALDLALGSIAADVAKDALDEIAAQGKSALPKISKALSSSQAEVRKYAFEKLEKIYPKGSLDPLLAALSSTYSDLRLGVIEKLAASDDARVTEALSRSLTSDHEDLRLRAAELLAERKDTRAGDVLATFLRHDNKELVARAMRALTRLGAAGISALATRLEEVTAAQRIPFIKAIGRCRHADGIDPLTKRFDDEDEAVRNTAFEAAIDLCDKDIKLSRLEQGDGSDDKEFERFKREKLRDMSRAIRVFRAGAKAKDPVIRAATADDLDVGEEVGQNEILISLFNDRDQATRVNAVTSYAYRVASKGAPLGPLEDVLKVGKRELVLPAAEGAAAKGLASSIKSLLLVVRAGEPGERERALLALGTLGNPKALEEIEVVSLGGTEEAPVEPSMQIAAIEALGRLAPKLTNPEDKSRIIDKVEETASTQQSDTQMQIAAIRGLRAMGGERSRTKLEAIMLDDSLDNEARTEAARQLGKILSTDSEQALSLSIKNSDYYLSDLRETARLALYRLFPNDRARVEMIAIDSEADDMASTAVAFLANEGDPGLLVPKLATLENDELRQQLRFGLLRRKQLPTASLASLLNSDLTKARQEAAWLIAARSGAEDITPLTEAERNKLADALVEGEKKTAALYAKTDGEQQEAEAEAWKRILWAGRELKADGLVKAANLLAKGGEKKGPAVARREAIRIIFAMGKSSEVDELTAALQDSDAEVRSAAAYALTKIDPKKAANIVMTAKPFDPIAFASTAAHADISLIEKSEGRRLLLPGLIARKEASALISLAKESAKNKDNHDDLFAALDAISRIGSDEAIAYLRTFLGEHKSQKKLFQAGYRAFKRAQRINKKAKKFEANA